MFKNYFKIAIRSLLKNKAYAFIKIGGLSIGMAVALLIGLWINDELSFNKYHENYEDIVKVLGHYALNSEVKTSAYKPIPLGKEIRTLFPDDFKYVVTSSMTDQQTLIKNEKKINANGNFMEKDAPEMLSLQMINGTKTALKEKNSILLSESLANVFFGNDDPVGELININGRKEIKITGVYRDFPTNSSFDEVEFIASWDLYLSLHYWFNPENWNSQSIQVFAQLWPTITAKSASDKIEKLKDKYVSKEKNTVETSYFLHPMAKWHLYEEFENGKNTGGNIQFVWLFGVIGIFVLLLACINFMNLSTARSEKRAMEVGVRKAVGSVRKQLVYQFLSESTIIAFLSFVLSIGLVVLMLPWFNQVAGKEIALFWSNPLFWIIGLGFTLLTGLIAGSYPALYLSSFKPVRVLKGTFKAGRYASLPRKVLVVTQFSVSIALIIGVIIIYQQIQFTKDRAIGYDGSGLVFFEIKTNDVYKHYNAIRADLLKTGGVVDMAQSLGFVTKNQSNSGGFEWKGKDPNFVDNFAFEFVSFDYGKTVGWQFTEGRDYSRDFASDSSAYIINEAAVKYMGLDDPIGEFVRHKGKDYKIIGVVKDVIAESPYKEVRPTIASVINFPGDILSIRLNPEIAMQEALSRIQPVIQKYIPTMPFEYKFTDQDYAKKFEAEERIGMLSGFFALLAIFISCLGLFGLASFVAEQRNKEIGVRKILGASIYTLWKMLSKDFVMLIMISCAIALPIGYFYMNQWLQNYQYRTEIDPLILIGTMLGAILITLLTVSFQAIKAATINPINSLRTE